MDEQRSDLSTSDGHLQECFHSLRELGSARGQDSLILILLFYEQQVSVYLATRENNSLYCNQLHHE